MRTNLLVRGITDPARDVEFLGFHSGKVAATYLIRLGLVIDIIGTGTGMRRLGTLE